MLARRYADHGVGDAPLAGWLAFLASLARDAFADTPARRARRPLLANQTEKDLPAGHGYLDHAFFGYSALIAAGFLPERRISCPMDGAYLPQHVRRARAEGRMLGQVRDLLVMRKARAGRASGHAARRRPARRPCPGRRGWRGSGCGGRSAREVRPRPAGPGLRARPARGSR